jgi:hypothetical protein
MRAGRVRGPGRTPIQNFAPCAIGDRYLVCVLPSTEWHNVRLSGNRYPSEWKLMSEADRIFPRQEGQGEQTSSTEKRFILSAPRRSGFGVGQSRVVEVVHVRRGRSRPGEDNQGPAPRNVRTPTWLEWLRPKSTLPSPQPDIQPAAPEPAQPTVHVVPAWEPSPQQPVEPVATPAKPSVETAVVECRKPRLSKSKTPKVTTRRFADPFAADDAGANCLRCGYLVEPAREKRGLMTCSMCS